MPDHDREHDVVLFGATGFTGGLTAEYLAANADRNGTRWAIAGRNQDKLKQVKERLGRANDDAVATLVADINDEASVKKIAESAKVVVTTVGPYINYGEPVVAACAAAGTDYVDLTGEPEFVDLMWLRHHEQAQRTGARLVHSCGFDSIPYDLGALYTVEQLPQDATIALEGFVRAGGTFSGGTYHSAVHAMGRLRQSQQVAAQRRKRERETASQSNQKRRVRGVTKPPHHDDVAGGWVLPFPTIDPQTVLRSARALDSYGPDFSYAHYMVAKRLATLAALTAGAGTLITWAQLPPTRKALLKLKSPGDGPTPEQRAKAWFKVRFRATTPDRTLVTEVSGGDPGYGETSKMLAESALCLAHDDLPDRAGQLTPAVAMGRPLIERLQRAGIKFQTEEP